MKEHGFINYYAKLFLLSVLIFTTSLAFAAPSVGSGDIKPKVWDVVDAQWENGLPRGYSEGETAAMVAEVVALGTSAQRQFEVCVEVFNAQMGDDFYSFTGFNTWNASHNPPTLPDGSASTFDDVSDPKIYAKNASIVSVSAPALGAGQCDPNAFGFTVVFTQTNNTASSFFAYGGVLAQAGATTPAGSPDAVVPVDHGAAFVNGTFQSFLAGVGVKTINFKGADISEIPGINLIKTVTTAAGTCPGTDSIIVIAGSQVKFCFEILNTGTADLIDVTLNDPILGGDITSSIISGLTDEDGDTNADDLQVGGTALAEVLFTVNQRTENTATATGSGISSEDSGLADVYVCGDGTTDPGEQCDDGNNDDTDACNNQCMSNFCGDGIINNGEQCDDANNVDGDACSNQCITNFCGDGVVNNGEACDDGNNDDFDTCNNQCVANFCGDGITNNGEQCDDGNNVDNDACSNTCINNFCGDGVQNNGEECDDGNNNDLDACNNQCTRNICGDGVVNNGEACDDGNNDNFDACSNNCVVNFCGDSIVNNGEQCDDGNNVDDDMCNNQCVTNFCGDGIVNNGEACDDGNNVDTDACNNQCVSNFCGDGIVNNGEQCDDGNNDDLDACSNACIASRCGDGIVNNGEACDDGNTVDDDACNNQCVVNFCGDGVVNNGEACDDGNNVDDDACNNQCVVNFCGDGIVNNGEACDDGNNVDDDACNNQCVVNFCGDGIVNNGEACDDGNADPLDACNNQCVANFCGDGIVNNGEACDDGNNDDTDACNNQCVSNFCGDGIVNNGEACDDGNNVDIDACNNQCVINFCGDRIVNNGEQCDDGGNVDGDGCSAICNIEICGNGILDPGEFCDDGNTNDGDGCSSACTIERNLTCSVTILSQNDCEGGINTASAEVIPSDPTIPLTYEWKADCDKPATVSDPTAAKVDVSIDEPVIGEQVACKLTVEIRDNQRNVGACAEDYIVDPCILGCNSVDQFETLFALDGIAEAQDDMNQRLSRITRKLRGKKTKTFALDASGESDSLYLQNWALTWTELPRITTQCENQIFCTNISNTSTVEQFDTNTDSLFFIAKSLNKRIKKKASGHKLLRKAKRWFKKAKRLRKEGKELTDVVPLTQSECTE